MHYDKLIRDHIPSIIAADGKTAHVETLSEADFRRALLAKLVEEANEVRDSTPQNLPLELADLLEVFDATVATFGLSMDEIKVFKEQRRQERGGFEKRLRLMSVETSTISQIPESPN